MPGERTDPAAFSQKVPPDAVSEVRDTVFAGTPPSEEVEFLPSLASLLAAPQGDDELGRLGPYRLLKLLGQGGMGAVFQAEDTQLHRPVALKVILPRLAASPGARERFLREARAIAGVRSDHVVTIYQVGEDRDIPFLAMELLQGESLEARLARGDALPWREAVRIGREVATGLAAAHEQGLVHRDVKPANVFLEVPSGRVKLLDFGLARLGGSESRLTHVGRVVGTPEFMSPEQARGEDLDGRSDLFSLGALLYTLCARRTPFQGDSLMAVLTALAVKDPPLLITLAPDVPPALADLVARLLDKDRDNRPASAREVEAALRAIAAGPPTPITLTTPRAPPATSGNLASRKTRQLGRKTLLAGLILVGVLGLLAAWLHFRGVAPAGPPIRIGVLHSRTGTMAISERPVIDAVLLAVEEINEAGGLLGRRVEAVLADGQSDETVFAREAERLIRHDRVCTLFGCWTSASRKAVVPVVTRHDHLLFYPVQYEGLEQSPHVVYLGPVPNQQILPALRWLVGFEGKRRWFLVGSDYVFPVAANAVIRDEARARGCVVVGETYLLLAATEVGPVVRQIVKARPDLIVNTINGDTNITFFRALRQAGIAPGDVPTLSLSISEEELSALGPRASAGDYVAANYFQSLDSPSNQEFLGRFGRRYGPERVVSSAMQTAYAGVHLWAKAVREAGRDDAAAIREAVKGQTIDAPQGTVRIDPATLHAVQVARVGRMDAGRLGEVYRSPQPVVAEPFPGPRSRQQWVTFLEDLHRRWGGRWSNPGPSGQ
jgi:urea transport system substrate-binding protein